MESEKKKILLVEDEALIAILEKKQLENIGYTVDHVSNGNDAVKSVIDGTSIYDLILMDIDLGAGIDGTQAAEQILSHIDIPIVFLSSHTEPEIVEKTEKLTSYGYVVKNSGIVILDTSIKMAFKLYDTNKKLLSELSERKLTEEKLKKRNEYIETIFSNMPIGFAVNSIDDGVVKYMNSKFEEIYGWSRDILSNVSIFFDKVFPDPEYRNLMMGKIISDMQSGEPDRMNWDNLKIVTKDNEERYVHAINIPVIDQNLMISTVQDVTMRNQMEKALRESELTFRKLFEDSADAILLIDQSGVFIECNQAALVLLKMTREQFLYKPPVDISPEYQADGQSSREKALKMIEIAYEKGLHRFDWICLNSEKKEFIVDVSLMPIKFKGQLMLHTTWRNITERKQAEEEIKKQLAEKEVFLREVHHRMKNNIANIESFLRLQSNSTVIPEVKASLQDAISRVQGMRIFYDKLLISRDTSEISILIYIKDLLDSIVSLFIVQNEIIVEKEISDFNISSKHAITIGIILNELLTNAFKYAFKDRDNGTIFISIKNIDKNIIMTVKDNGIGFNEKFIDDNSHGFGLAIVKMLVEQLNGTYDIKAEKGTEIVIKFSL
ncbi:MAG: PAS domain S-box protein [Spirochaetes bacterium]|nr:PAS domain S-box protein [Spirochaetota bacterium]